ncbi:MAG: hypothetical protein HFG89_11825 [Dorea sp.]|nr:hypothetical protein [Dorea sp.]
MESKKNNFYNEVKKILSGKLGETAENEGVLRSFARDLGIFGRNAIVEVAWMKFTDDAQNAWPILQFYSTLAVDIEEKDVPGIKRRLCDLNEETMLGRYGYYAPMRQLYHCYRLPVDLDSPESSLALVDYSLIQILRQLDAFLDYVLVIADAPESMDVEEYALTTHAGDILGECLGVLHRILEEEFRQL